MRTLYLLMAIYVFGLSLMTCTDGMHKDDCGTAIHIHDAGDMPHHEEEACTPFCVCSCCGSPFIAKLAFTFTVQPCVNEQLVIPSPKCTSAIPPSIWQPPKIS